MYISVFNTQLDICALMYMQCIRIKIYLYVWKITKTDSLQNRVSSIKFRLYGNKYTYSTMILIAKRILVIYTI